MDHPTQGAALLSLGSINLDVQVRVDAEWESGTTPNAWEPRLLSGGKAANVALFVQRLGCKSVLLGRVGDDEVAQRVLAPLHAAGVNTAAVRVGRGERTGVAIIVVPPDGQERSVVAAEANGRFDDDDIAAIEAQLIAAAPGSVLAVDHEVTPQAASRAIRVACARGLRVVLDPSVPLAIERSDLRLIQAITPNVAEALTLAGSTRRDRAGLESAMRAIAALGPALVCIKLDEGGCLWLHEGQAWHQQAAPVARVDTTGAGDAFTGALALALLENQPVRHAIGLAVAASELAVMSYGAQAGYGDRAALERHLAATDRPLTRWDG